ncbi:MAG TPA: class IIb bacteriocin, lactobin A/cerein 7B family [Prolixibacteraceae bacterium]|nr:class IIb bacteriocin, lactobin A/cerein 7B family [Prolixibacteraceae bacterium]
MNELNEFELKKVDGGIFPVVILGVVITTKAAAWIIAGCVFAAGAYVGYQEAAEESGAAGANGCQVYRC